MICPDIVDLERYVLSELDEAQCATLGEHLNGCEECARQMAELEENLRLAPALRRDVNQPLGDLPQPPGAMPERVGPYLIVGRIGQGGMGSVYEARQENPRRAVALKMIRPGLISSSLLARFRHEAQVLGRLRHPGIAQIYEAGTHHTPGAAPQPYFAMELVHGPTLIDYATAKGLPVPRRLELLARVCDAVHHAHQRGVIHRDLKPDNILVDDSSAGEAQPKILDFGVARLVDPDGQTTTLHTSVGQIVGTIAYMSPEQAGADPAEVDTRSDVYALGVIGYQLLTGRLPYRLDAASVAESVRIIVQDDPTPLSTVDRALRGDVTTIVGKAMEKDKSRRYQSAAEIAADLRRYLRDEPIIAHAPSTVYQLRKFARRNKGLVAGVTLAFVVLFFGIIGTSIGMIYANSARAAADLSARQAQREADKQAAVNAFLQEMLSAANPRMLSAQDRAKGRNVSVLEALNAAAEKVELGSLTDQPEIEIAVRNSIGVAYLELGQFDRSARHLETALERARRYHGAEHQVVAEICNSLATLRRVAGKSVEAEEFARQALNMSRKVLGEEHRDVAIAMNGLSLILSGQGRLDEAEDLLRQAMRIQAKVMGDQSRQVATLLNNLALLLEEQGKLNEAEPLFRQALDIRRKIYGEEHPDVAVVLNNMGFLLRAQRKLDEAETMFRRALEMRRKLLGEDHTLVALGMNNLASLLQAVGRFDEAEPLYRQSLEIDRKAHGEEHPSIASTLNNLATLSRDRGDLTGAEPLFREALAMRRRVHGEDHPSVALGLANLGGTLRDLGRAEEAEPIVRQALAIAARRLGEDHIDTASYRTHVGACLVELSHFDQAERELLRARSAFERSQLPASDKRVQSCTRNLIKLYEAWGKPAQAAAYTALLSTTAPAITQPATQPVTAQR